MNWTSTAIDRLRELTDLGRSNMEIARYLGVTKGAVSGARFRYLVPARKPAPEPQPIVPLLQWPGPHECHWIGNDDLRRPQWCMRRTRPESPYCPEHHARCYTTRTYPHDLPLAVALPRR